VRPAPTGDKFCNVSNLNLGRQIRRRREDRGISQATLAKRAGISISTLKRLEAGQPCAFPKLFQISRELEISLDELAVVVQ